MGWLGNVIKTVTPFVPLIGDVVSGIFGSKSQESANETNIALQREQREWQERMSNTSYQRGTADMLKAGINPMVAFSQGGAATPNVSAATVQPVDALARATSSAAAKAAQALQLQNLKLQNDQLAEKVEQEKITTDNMKSKYGVTGGTSILDAEMNTVIDKARLAKSDADIREIEKQIAEQTLGYNVSSAKSLAEIREREVTITELRAILMRLDIPEKEAMAKWFETVGSASPMAKAIMSIGTWLKFIFGGK